MTARDLALIVLGIIIGAGAVVAASDRGPRTYEECVLKEIRGLEITDGRAKLVRHVCESRFGPGTMLNKSVPKPRASL